MWQKSRLFFFLTMKVILFTNEGYLFQRLRKNSHGPLCTNRGLFPLLVAVEDFCWNVFQLVGYSLMWIKTQHPFKSFLSQGSKRSHRENRLRNDKNAFFCQKFIAVQYGTLLWHNILVHAICIFKLQILIVFFTHVPSSSWTSQGLPSKRIIVLLAIL